MYMSRMQYRLCCSMCIHRMPSHSMCVVVLGNGEVQGVGAGAAFVVCIDVGVGAIVGVCAVVPGVLLACVLAV